MEWIDRSDELELLIALTKDLPFLIMETVDHLS